MKWQCGNKEPHAVEILEEMAKILEVPLKYLLIEEEKRDIMENPIIRDLILRVSRLEQRLN